MFSVQGPSFTKVLFLHLTYMGRMENIDNNLTKTQMISAFPYSFSGRQFKSGNKVCSDLF